MDLTEVWLSLKAVPGIGNRLFRVLIDRFGGPEAVLRASEKDLLGVEGVSPRLASAIRRHKMPPEVVEDLRLAKDNNIDIITMNDPAYPDLLRHIYDPPPVLYVLGALEPDSLNIAVVGSRNATGYGLAVTERLSGDLVARGFTIVSGMARGIDAAAHWGALRAGGRTVAVLGCGLGTIYPSENTRLFHKIAQSGAVISEFPHTTAPEAYNFPARNRVISGLSLGTVIVEATRKSGSLITARLAAEQGREVFAVPGSVASFKSTGTHGLIKEGAKLVESANDIVEELNLGGGIAPCKENKTEIQTLSEQEKMVLDVLSPYPVHIDQLVRQLPLVTTSRISSLLVELELKGLVTQIPGKRFVKTDLLRGA